jgi:dephospho-CoA kinase
MPITKKDFHDIEHKVITLMGMSGVGKTYLSLMLSEQGWYHYSCDLEIGTNILGKEIEETLNEPNRVTADDLSQLSNYVSRLGDLPYDEFKRRQQKYLEAECGSLKKLPQIVEKAKAQGFQNVLNDSTGSLCEIDDDLLLDTVDENSLIVYIKANAEEEKAVLQRAQDYPKPMFFSPERFDYWVSEYSADKGGISADDFDADDFGRWVFPRLFENRLPKYQAIADKYGTTIPSEEFHKVKTSDDFLNLIVRYLPDSYK